MNKQIEKLITLSDTPKEFNKLAESLLKDAINKIAGDDLEKLSILNSIQWRYKQELRNLTGVTRYNKAVILFYKQLEKFREVLEK